MKSGLLRSENSTPSQMSTVLGVLYLSGSLLVILSLVLPHPPDANELALVAIAGTAVAVGASSIIWAKVARLWMVHTVLATGTALICLCVYFSSVAAGIYSTMFVWVVLTAAFFFSAPGVASHVAWILLTYGVTLAVVPESSGFSGVTRWTLTSLVLVVAAAVMSEIVAGRRATEEQLRTEIDKKAQLQRELEHLAHHDPLTGLANRRLFEEVLTRELSRANRQNVPLCLIALDLDAFKEYNDAHGHVAGDRLLKLVASVWARALRTEDLIARFGGDEFIALLPNCPRKEAERVMKRLCEGTPPDCSCSAGIAVRAAGDTPDALLFRADQAMYEAKNNPIRTSLLG